MIDRAWGKPDFNEEENSNPKAEVIDVLLLQFVEEGEYISVLEMIGVPVTGGSPMLISKAV